MQENLINTIGILKSKKAYMHYSKYLIDINPFKGVFYEYFKKIKNKKTKFK